MRIRTVLHGGMIRHFLASLMLLACFVIGAGTSSSALASPNRSPSPDAFNQHLQAQLTAKMQEMQVPGAVIFVRSPRTGSWTTSLGISNIATHTPMSPNMYFRIGSITKTLTGTVILQLAQEGKLRLDDPVAKYQPKVPNGEKITVRDLLNMKSGLYNYSEDPTFVRQIEANPSRVWTPQELLTVSFKHPAYFASGQNFRYSNTNFILLGMIIEQLTRQPVEQVFQQRIFTPLNMSQTEFPARPSATMPAPYTQGYMLSLPGSKSNFSGKPINVTTWNPSWNWTAGSAISTLHDMEIWAKALATGQLLSPAMQKERLIWGTNTSGKPSHGLAIADFSGFVGYNGQIPGYQVFTGYMPGKDETIVVMTNLYAASDGSEPADNLAKLIVHALSS